MLNKTSLLRSLGLAGAACLLVQSTALAGGFGTARFGGDHGYAVGELPTSVYYNPAAIALGSGTRVYVEGLFFHRSVDYERPEAAIDNPGTGTPDDAIAANAGKAELDNYFATPFLGFTSDLGTEKLTIGGGFYVPFGGQAKWGTNEAFADSEQYPGAYDGVQRWASIEGTQRVLYFTGAASYDLPHNVTIGIGLNLLRSEISTLRARTASGQDDLVSEQGAVLEGRSLAEVSTWNFSVGAGIMYQPIEALILGFSYQSQPGFGQETLEGTLTNKFGASAENTTDVELTQELPDVWRIGASYRPTPESEVRFGADWTNWSVYDRQCLLDQSIENRKCATLPDGSPDADNGGAGIINVLERNYEDTWSVRLGGSYWLSPALELFAGGSFDTNAVPDETIDAALMDMNKIIGSGGVRYDVTPALRLTAAYTQVFYLERTAAPRMVAPQPPSRSPDGAGTYDQGVQFFSLGVLYMR